MFWAFTEFSPAHRSGPFGLNWTQTFDRISGLGLDGKIFGWAGPVMSNSKLEWAVFEKSKMSGATS